MDNSRTVNCCSLGELLADLCTWRDGIGDIKKEMMMATKEEAVSILLNVIMTKLVSLNAAAVIVVLTLELAISSWAVDRY